MLTFVLRVYYFWPIKNSRLSIRHSRNSLPMTTFEINKWIDRFLVELPRPCHPQYKFVLYNYYYHVACDYSTLTVFTTAFGIRYLCAAADRHNDPMTLRETTSALSVPPITSTPARRRAHYRRRPPGFWSCRGCRYSFRRWSNEGSCSSATAAIIQRDTRKRPGANARDGHDTRNGFRTTFLYCGWRDGSRRVGGSTRATKTTWLHDGGISIGFDGWRKNACRKITRIRFATGSVRTRADACIYICLFEKKNVYHLHWTQGRLAFRRLRAVCVRGTWSRGRRAHSASVGREIPWRPSKIPRKRVTHNAYNYSDRQDTPDAVIPLGYDPSSADLSRQISGTGFVREPFVNVRSIQFFQERSGLTGASVFPHSWGGVKYVNTNAISEYV